MEQVRESEVACFVFYMAGTRDEYWFESLADSDDCSESRIRISVRAFLSVISKFSEE